MHLSRLLAPALLVLALPVAHAQTSVHLGLRLGLNAASRSGEEPVGHPESGFGGNPPTITYSQDYTRSAVLAAQFGAVLDVRFGHLALQPAVLFSQKGVDQRNHINYTVTYNSPISGIPGSRIIGEEKYYFTSRPNYLEIPLNVAYTFGDDHGFQVFGGPYVAFGVGGQVQYEAERQYNYANSGQNYGSNYSYGTSFYQFRDSYPEPTLKSANSSPTTYPTSFGENSAPSLSRRFDAGLNLGVGYRQGPLQVQLGYGLGLVNQQVAKASTQRDELPAFYQRVTQLTATYFLKVK